MVIYRTNEWNGSGKQNYYWNEYRREEDTIYKYKCHRYKHFDGHESEWIEDEICEDSWEIDSQYIPDWLKQYI